MTQRTYSDRIIVLRKTKLGESDLIVTMLAQDGRQLRAVAKGARKPASTFASRLELYSVADVLCAYGRNLDIVKEVRLVHANAPLRNRYDASISAAPIAEIAATLSQSDLQEEKLFAVTQAAFAALAENGSEHAPALCAAALLKIFAFCGIRPSFSRCVSCGTPDPYSSADAAADIRFSVEEGGVLCPSCARLYDAMLLPLSTVMASHALLHTAFSDIVSDAWDAKRIFPVLQLCGLWSRYHAGTNPKSLGFLISNYGL